MSNIGYYSYLTSTIAFTALFFFALRGIRDNPFGLTFLLGVGFSVLWSGYTVYVLSNDQILSDTILPLEVLRNGTWYYLLMVLISEQRTGDKYKLIFSSPYMLGILSLVIVLTLMELFPESIYFTQQYIAVDFRLFAHVALAIIGLSLVEQLYRNALSEHRWSIKFICLGLGGIFTVDFILYSKSMLFSDVDVILWNTRGWINAIIVPLLAISSNRMQEKDYSLTISRQVIFHTTSLVGTGIYLILMSLAGYYIKLYGGSWGEAAQIFFIFLAIMVLIVLFVSGKIRAIAKVYFNKHFFQYNYDYRQEWIKVSRILAQHSSFNELSVYIIKTLADLVESSGGGLWLKDHKGNYYLAENYNLGFDTNEKIPASDSVVNFLQDTHWVIDFVEYFNEPEAYDLDLSRWEGKNKNVWLIIPLFQQNDLEAFVVLSKARVARKLNWEDHDLLKTVGMQLVNALALHKASDELLRVRQFEAYNRLSAFVVHDLKNLVAQISMIVKNAEKHKRNPEFIDDAIETLENVVKKMSHLVDQLRKGKQDNNPQKVIDILQVLKDVVIQQSANKPVPEISTMLEESYVSAEKEKLTAILGHLVQNAQEATDDDGYVMLNLAQEGENAILEIKDNGSGMDEKFIAEKLFKPFETTKGNAGMGIGVYEAKDYIQQQGGHIEVTSKPGEGTCFTVTLPLAMKQKLSDITL